MTEDEMVGWHHRLNEHECEQTPGDGEGKGSLACCSPCGHKGLDMTQQLSIIPGGSAYSLVAQLIKNLPAM